MHIIISYDVQKQWPVCIHIYLVSIEGRFMDLEDIIERKSDKTFIFSKKQIFIFSYNWLELITIKWKGLQRFENYIPKEKDAYKRYTILLIFFNTDENEATRKTKYYNNSFTFICISLSWSESVYFCYILHKTHFLLLQRFKCFCELEKVSPFAGGQKNTKEDKLGGNEW